VCGPSPCHRGHGPAYRWRCPVGCETSPGPWSVASHGCPDLVDIRSLKGTVVSKSGLDLKPLTVVTTLSHRFCTYEFVSPFERDMVYSSNLASNHHSLLRSFSWPALLFLSVAHHLSKWVGRSIYSMLDSTDQRKRRVLNHN